MRMCDLPVRIEGTPLADRIEQLGSELAARGLRFRPHFWLSDEWFTPDGVPGVAIPFYLAHPRLMRLERKQMLEVEGGTEAWCMKILRHEAGHAIDNAYRLRRPQALSRGVRPAGRCHIPKYYRPSPTARASCCTWTCGTPRATRRKISPRPSPCGSSRGSRLAVRSTQGGRRCSKLEYVDELMSEIAATSR